MKALRFVVSLAATLVALHANAQLGPAGVPGAPGLAETDPSVKPAARAPQVAPPAATSPQAQPVQPRKRTPTDCTNAKDVAQCKARLAAHNKALVTCKGKTGTQRKQCMQEQTQKVDCSKSAEPARCERHQKARELCKDKLGREHSQCLRDNLVPKK